MLDKNNVKNSFVSKHSNYTNTCALIYKLILHIQCIVGTYDSGFNYHEK